MKEQSIVDIAVRDVIKADSSISIKTAADIITEKKIRNLVICDKTKNSYFVLSVGDVVSAVKGHIDLNKPVSSLKLPQLVTCSKNTTILEAVMLFGDGNAIVGVLDDSNSLIGVVTYSNLLNAIYGYEDDSFLQPIKNLLAKDDLLVAHMGENLTNHLDTLNLSNTDCLIIIKNGLPHGIITKRDIVKMLAKNISLDQNVECLMSSPLMTVDSDVSINSALTYMQNNKLKRVIVVDKDGKLEGVITQKALLDAMYSKLIQKGFFDLSKINTLLQEQVNLKTLELQQLNKDLEKRIQDAMEELRESERALAAMRRNEALFELLQNIAHHWRQPLNIISLLAQESEVILKYDGDIDSVIQNLRSIVSETEMLSSTIDKMTSIHKSNSVENVKIDFKILFSYTLGLFAASHAIQIETLYEVEEFEFYMQSSALQFIFKELVDNSIKVALKNNKQSLKFILSVKKEEKLVFISLQDNAGGIDEKDIERIFDPYFTTEFKSRNKGLGLYMIKNLIEKSIGGKISAYPLDNGIRFDIRLPL